MLPGVDVRGTQAEVALDEALRPRRGVPAWPDTERPRTSRRLPPGLTRKEEHASHAAEDEV